MTERKSRAKATEQIVTVRVRTSFDQFRKGQRFQGITYDDLVRGWVAAGLMEVEESRGASEAGPGVAESDDAGSPQE